MDVSIVSVVATKHNDSTTGKQNWSSTWTILHVAWKESRIKSVVGVALTVWALYEIGEHIAGPVMAVLYATGHVTFN